MRPSPVQIPGATGPAIYGASSGNSVIPTAAVANQDVNADTKNDIVVANEASAGSNPGIGVLENAGAGTFPAAATPYTAGSVPDSLALGNFMLNPIPPPAPATAIDAAIANYTSLGGVTIIPSDGAGNFTGAQTTVTFPDGSFTSAIASGNFDGTGASIVAVNQGTNQITPSIYIIPHDNVGAPVNVPIPSADMSGLIDPRAVVVGDYNGDGVQDFAILSGSPTSGGRLCHGVREHDHPRRDGQFQQRRSV